MSARKKRQIARKTDSRNSLNTVSDKPRRLSNAGRDDPPEIPPEPHPDEVVPDQEPDQVPNEEEVPETPSDVPQELPRQEPGKNHGPLTYRAVPGKRQSYGQGVSL